MPRVHFVKKARKDNPAVKAGESYYWWKFRRGGKRFSATPPRQSQLTQSAYFAALYDLMDTVNEWAGDEAADFVDFIDNEVKGVIEELKDEQQEKLYNMEEYGLQYTPVGELIQERLDALESAEYDLDIDDFEFDKEDFDLEEEDLEEGETLEEREQEHEDMEEDRFQTEYSEWLEDQKSAIVDAIGNAMV